MTALLNEAARRMNLPVASDSDASEAFSKAIPAPGPEIDSAPVSSISQSKLEVMGKAPPRANSVESGVSRIEVGDNAGVSILSALPGPQAKGIYASGGGGSGQKSSNGMGSEATSGEMRRRLVLLTLLRPRVNQKRGKSNSLPEPEVLSCRQSWNQAGARNVDLYAYHLVLP